MGTKELIKNKHFQMIIFFLVITFYVIYENIKYGIWDFILIMIALFVLILLIITHFKGKTKNANKQ